MTIENAVLAALELDIDDKAKANILMLLLLNQDSSKKTIQKNTSQDKTNVIEINNDCLLCEHCQIVFKKKTTWQRFCSKDCQMTAYELRTGRRLNFNKSENTPC